MKKVTQEIENILNNFETTPWTDNVKLLKEDFDINSLGTPNQYLNAIDELEELTRQARLLFLYSVLKIVCKEENKLYNFETPFHASMRYDGVMKKEDRFYLLDEDGHYTEIFTSENFTRFIDDSYWKLYEEE